MLKRLLDTAREIGSLPELLTIIRSNDIKQQKTMLLTIKLM